jgi:hypothetical protein
VGASTGNNAFNFAHFCTFVPIFAHSPMVELDCAPTLKTTGVCYAAMAQNDAPTHVERHELADAAMA